jgi:hypothetical protein
MAHEMLLEPPDVDEPALARWLALPEEALGATTGVVETVPGCEGLTLDLDALWTCAAPLTSPAASADEPEEDADG